MLCVTLLSKIINWLLFCVRCDKSAASICAIARIEEHSIAKRLREYVRRSGLIDALQHMLCKLFMLLRQAVSFRVPQIFAVELFRKNAMQWSSEYRKPLMSEPGPRLKSLPCVSVPAKYIPGTFTDSYWSSAADTCSLPAAKEQHG